MRGGGRRRNETARPGRQLAADCQRTQHRDVHGHAAVPAGCRPKSVPKLRRHALSAPEDIHGLPADETGPTASASRASDSGAETAPSSRAPRISLEAEVQRFAEDLLRRYPNRVKRRPQAFKRRVLALIGLHLPPLPKPSGRPQQPRITRAAAMYSGQQREIAQGRRERINWNPIATRCIAGYRRIRSEASRQAELRRLRDAVYRRLGGTRKIRPRNR